MFGLDPSTFSTLFLTRICLGPDQSNNTETPRYTIVIVGHVFQARVVIVVEKYYGLNARNRILDRLRLQFRVRAFIN